MKNSEYDIIIRKNKVITPFTFSLKLKKMGFKDETDFQYRISDKKGAIPDLSELYKANDHGEFYISAPYINESIDWLLREYGICGNPCFLYENGINKYYYSIGWKYKEDIFTNYPRYYHFRRECIIALLEKMLEFFPDEKL